MQRLFSKLKLFNPQVVLQLLIFNLLSGCFTVYFKFRIHKG